MALGRAIGRLARQARQRSLDQRPVSGLEEGPRSAFEMVTRRGLDDLVKDFERLEMKVNGLIFGVALTFVLEVWKSFR
jgi:hypothetical protein